MTSLRILALAGCGSSAEVLHAQTQSFRGLLPANWTFDFVNGEHTCLPADGIGEIYPAPYYCWYNLPTFDGVKAAHDFVLEIMEDEGPFDAVMAYSQGAAVAASLILHHQHENPYSPPLFRFVIFLNAILPYSKSPEFGLNVTGMFVEKCIDEGRVWAPTDDDRHEGNEAYGEFIEKGHTWETLPVRRFSPATHKDKINVPTAHIYGTKDEWRAQSLRVLEMCDQTQAVSFEHCGAHDIPRTADQSKEMAKVILATHQKAQFIIV